jgi:hypothetical protein
MFEGERAIVTAERMSRDDVERLYDELYEQYGNPLEVKHRGECVAISPRGETILGASLLEVAQEAKAKFGTGNFIYRVGARAVGRWR